MPVLLGAAVSQSVSAAAACHSLELKIVPDDGREK